MRPLCEMFFLFILLHPIPFIPSVVASSHPSCVYTHFSLHIPVFHFSCSHWIPSSAHFPFLFSLFIHSCPPPHSLSPPLLPWQHFVCAWCERPYQGQPYYERQGHAYCETHFNMVRQYTNKTVDQKCPCVCVCIQSVPFPLVGLPPLCSLCLVVFHLSWMMYQVKYCGFCLQQHDA